MGINYNPANSGQIVDDYINTAYDTVKVVADNLTEVVRVADLSTTFQASSTPPTTRADGNPLESGDRYFNESNTSIYTWDATGLVWIVEGSTNTTYESVTIDATMASTGTISLTNPYVVAGDNKIITVQGVIQYPGTDYTETDTATLDFGAGVLVEGDTVFSIVGTSVAISTIDATATTYTPDGGMATTIAAKLNSLRYATLAAVITDVSNLQSGYVLDLAERVSGSGGGLTGDVIADTGGALSIAEGGFRLMYLGSDLTLQLRVEDKVIVTQWTSVDGTTDNIAAMIAADAYAYANSLPLELTGSMRTTATFSVTAPTLITNYATITKDVDDTEVVRFISNTGGASGSFTTHRGYLYVTQSAKPTTIQTAAHAFVFEDVVLTHFGSLKAGHCAYGFKNDSSSAHALCWGNYFEHMEVRGCVQGYLDWEFAGTGAHTENYVATAYFNGKQPSSATLLEKEDYPINLDAAEGFRFGTLNMEWTKRNGGGHFINVLNGTTLGIGSFHFEGNESTVSGDYGIFNITSSADNPVNVAIENMHINSITQSTGKLSLVFASATSYGTCTVGSFSGRVSSNTISDLRVIDYDGPFVTSLGINSKWADYFTAEKVGNNNSDFKPQLYIGGYPYDYGFSLTDQGATVNVGKASYMRLLGTQAASLATITATAVENERDRLLTIENDTGGPITITSTGNILAPYGTTFDLTMPVQSRMLVSINVVDNAAHIIGLSI